MIKTGVDSSSLEGFATKVHSSSSAFGLRCFVEVPALYWPLFKAYSILINSLLCSCGPRNFRVRCISFSGLFIGNSGLDDLYLVSVRPLESSAVGTSYVAGVCVTGRLWKIPAELSFQTPWFWGIRYTFWWFLIKERKYVSLRTLQREDNWSLPLASLECLMCLKTPSNVVRTHSFPAINCSRHVSICHFESYKSSLTTKLCLTAPGSAEIIDNLNNIKSFNPLT